MEAEEARALFELQLELHQLALGLRPNISSDEMVELRALGGGRPRRAPSTRAYSSDRADAGSLVGFDRCLSKVLAKLSQDQLEPG